MADPESFVTPEAVVLERDVAGLGTRFIGALVDTTVQTLVLLVVAAASSAMGPDGQVILLSVTGILLVFAYPAMMETVTRGRTLGKMAARTRVVRTDGSPVTFAPVLVRNLVRIVDLLPGAYAVGAISILVTRRGQRLGDLAAGTLVVYDVPGRVPEPLVLAASSEHQNARRGMDAAGLSPREYGVVRAFLVRRNSLEPAARAHLAADLQARLRDRVGTADPDAPPEVFLEALAAAYRERHQR
jgi:uncharacterized RDD family membrane protein YckC